MPVVPAPPPTVRHRRLILTRLTFALLTLTLLLIGCQPDPIQLLPLPPGMDYPWRLSPVQHAVLEAQTRIHDAVEQGGGTHSGASADSTIALRPTAALPIDGSANHGTHWDFGLSDLTASDSTASDWPPSAGSSRSVTGHDHTTASAPSNPGSPIELNTATQAELESLPRVGPAMAERIIAARPFRRPSDLRRVRGIGPATWELLEPLVTVDGEFVE